MARFTTGVFISDEVLLSVSFAAAQARLANLARGGSLLSASQAAYDEGITGLVRVGPLGSGPGISRLVQVHFRDLVTREGSAVLTLRWETAGPGGGLFPALDADITLTPAGEQVTSLKLAGAYRPPLGAVGAGLDGAILHRVATAIGPVASSATTWAGRIRQRTGVSVWANEAGMAPPKKRTGCPAYFEARASRCSAAPASVISATMPRTSRQRRGRHGS